MKIIAKPIDIIVTFRKRDKPVPYKFKYPKDTGEMQEIKIDKIICVEESNLAGIAALVYTCQTEIDNQLKIYQLKYIIEEYRWELYKI
ncbi:MAG: hypothetical protein RR313_03565 [Anaerovoracaceae bacterium]